MAATVSRRAMEEERDFLLRSIADLDRELASDDLTEEDHRRLRDGYTARAAVVLRRLEELERTEDVDDVAEDRVETADGHNASEAASTGVQVAGRPASRRGGRGAAEAGRRGSRIGRAEGRRRRGVIAAVVVVCFVAVAVALVITRSANRLPGQTSSGSVTLTDDQRLAQQMSQARVLATQGDDLDAVKLYDKVLAVEPRQPEALAYRGWLLRLAGVAGHDQTLLAQGRASIGAAVADDPGYPDARVFLGYVLFQDAHDPVGAVQQFRAFLADHPQAQMVSLTHDVVAQAFAAVGQPVPPASPPTGP